MAAYSIQCQYMFNYDFSLGEAFVQNVGFSNVMNSSTFQYSYQSPLSKVSTTIFIRNIPSNTQVHLTVLDSSGEAIPGSEEFLMDGPCMKSVYTFDTPLPSNTPMKFKVSSTLTSAVRIDMCGIVITE